MSPLTLHFTGRVWTVYGVVKNGLRSAEFDRLFRGIAERGRVGRSWPR